MTEKEFLHQRELLGNRSSKILGGYVTEQLFVDTFVTEDVTYTQSWWFSKTSDQQIFWFVEKRELSELDKVIHARLRSNCFQLYLEDGQWSVCSMSTGQVWTVSAFVEAYKLSPIPKKMHDTDESAYERDLIASCIDYYGEKNMLEDIQRSIQIEDLFLNRYFFTSNLDLMIGKKEKDGLIPVCIEIKFKDPFFVDSQAVYGIDRYQLVDEYRILEEAGILTYAVILNNTCREKIHKQSTNIFRYLEQVKQEDREWIYSRISKQVPYPEYTMVSQKTGFTGVSKKARPVLCIPKTNLHPLNGLQTLLNDKRLLDAQGQEISLCPECSRILKLKKGKNGEFWGCSGYPKCKYTKQK